MKILAIGDLHGNNFLDRIKELTHLYDKIIFIGDYTDSFDFTSKEIVTNLMLLIQFAKDHPDKVVLLFGNHDIQYWFFRDKYMLSVTKCSGYRASYAFRLNDIFWEYRNVFSLAYQVDDFLFTHAGISQSFYSTYLMNWEQDIPGHLGLVTLADKLNFYFYTYNRHMELFNIGPSRGGGKEEIGGPLWIDMSELRSDMLQGYHQIVGHSHRSKLELVYNTFGSTSVAFIDILPKVLEEDSRLINNQFYHIDTENYYVSTKKDIEDQGLP